jgi:recombination associated protein RdgC
VRYVKHTLDADDTRRHIAAGKQCTRLAMTWDDKVSFVLTETLAIKGVKPLDVITEKDTSTRNEDERFDNDMMLMTGELARMLGDIVAALGGEADDLVSKAQSEAIAPSSAPAAPAETALGVNGPDPLYDEAAAIVLKQSRASISLLQRHLRVGYNRAARLIEAMEQRGVVGPMQSNGDRAILAAAP